MGQALCGERLADEVFLIGRAGDQRAAAVEEEDRSARTLHGGRYQFADPLQIDHRKHDAIDGVVVADHGKRGDEARPLMNPVDQVIAQREVTGMQRILKMRTIGHVQSDHVGLGRACDAAVGSGDRQAADPGHVAGERGQVLIAVRRLGRHLGIGAGDDLQERAHGIDDLALRFRAATRQIDHFGAGAVDTMAAGQFQSVNAVEHQRRDGQKREHEQAGADAQNRLAPPRRRLARLCLIVQHRAPSTPSSIVLDTRKSGLRGFAKI